MECGIYYIDGLVSTGNKIPNTILNILFTNAKKNRIFFIHKFRNSMCIMMTLLHESCLMRLRFAILW